MSELQDIGQEVLSVASEIARWVPELHGRAGQLRQAAARAAQAVGTDGDSVRALRVAQALSHAAQCCDRAAQHLVAGKAAADAFVYTHVGGGGAGGGPSGGGGSVESAQAAGDITSADAAALADYTGAGYLQLNAALRGQGDVTEDLAQRAEAVSRALHKLPDYAGTSYRGAELTPEQASRYVPGSVVREPAFTSTTNDPRKTFGGNTYFVVQSQHGKEVSQLSNVPHESEVLFDKGAQFHVVSNDFDGRTGRRVIVLMEM